MSDKVKPWHRRKPRPEKKNKRVIPLTVDSSRVRPLTVDDSRVIPMTVDDWWDDEEQESFR